MAIRVFQWTAGAWTARQAQMNAAAGTSINVPLAVANAIGAASQQDAETARILLSVFENQVTTRDTIAGIFGAGFAGVTSITNMLAGMKAQWPDYLPAVPAVNPT